MYWPTAFLLAATRDSRLEQAKEAVHYTSLFSCVRPSHPDSDLTETAMPHRDAHMCLDVREPQERTILLAILALSYFHMVAYICLY